MKRNTFVVLISLLTVITCCMCTVAAGSVYWLATRDAVEGGSFASDHQSASTTADAANLTSDQSTKESANSRVAAPPPSQAELLRMSENLRRAEEAVLPREDLADLAVRFRGASPDAMSITCTQERSYATGATRTFTMSNQDNNTQFVITATLAYQNAHVYMWVETEPTEIKLDQERLKKAADTFDSEIYKRTRDFFGSEPQPGVDCDPHLHIVHAAEIGSSVGGYFSAPDTYPRAVRKDSNEGQVFVMHAAPGYNGSDPGSNTYMSTMAHEFQHMISFNNNHAPDLWLEEGAAQFSEQINNYGSNIGTPYEFASRPETQLNTWEESSAGANGAHYGGGYLFWSYLHDRFGEEIVRKLARAPERSEQSFMHVLADAGVRNPDTDKPFTFEQLFADFVVANYMSKTKIEASGNRYNYTTISVPPIAKFASYGAGEYPIDTTETLNQFGTHYIELRGNTTVTVRFNGAAVADLLPMNDQHGEFWWSNRSDVSDPRLTREFDLSSVKKATLNFRAWYRLEHDYDYAYASVSIDGGKTWKLLKTRTCTTSNPQNANFGCGWNGASSKTAVHATEKTQPAPQWIDESADLSEYAGHKIQLRFEAVTDAGVSREGLAIDDIRVPEIGYSDDAEKDVAVGDGGWNSEGWVRVGNALPQRWCVQLLVVESTGTRTLQRMSMNDADGSGEITLNFSRTTGARNMVLMISPITQVTTEPASYRLRIK
ncbi:MAG: immune inhibitor A [Chloroflexi bacterium]|nr:immune inhibitor A [Chloroflexota bacterium]